MSMVVSIQRGSESIAAGDGTTIDITISAVTLANAVAFITLRNADFEGRLKRHVFQWSLSSTTNLRLVRHQSTSSRAIVVEWIVIDFEAAEIEEIQSGTIDCDADPEDVTVNAVVLADTLVIASPLTSKNTADGDVLATTLMSSTTVLRFDFAATPLTGEANYSYQILEFASGASTVVQVGTVALSTTENSDTATITSVDTSSTAVLLQGLNIDNGSAAMYRNCARLTLTDATTITAERSGTGTTKAMNVGYAALEFTGSEVVESGTGTVADTATSNNPTFTEIGADHAHLSTFFRQNAWNSASEPGGKDPEDAYFTFVVSATPDDIVVARTGSEGAFEFAYFIVDFTAAAAGGAELLEIPHHMRGGFNPMHGGFSA